MSSNGHVACPGESGDYYEVCMYLQILLVNGKKCLVRNTFQVPGVTVVGRQARIARSSWKCLIFWSDDRPDWTSVSRSWQFDEKQFVHAEDVCLTFRCEFNYRTTSVGNRLHFLQSAHPQLIRYVRTQIFRSSAQSSAHK